MSADGIGEPPGLIGYASRLGVRPGERIRFHVGASVAGTAYQADVVRLRCVDRRSDGPGFREERIPSAIDGDRIARVQRVDRGSRGIVPAAPVLAALSGFTIGLTVWPTRPGSGRQALVGTWNDETRKGFALLLDEHGRPALVVGDGRSGAVELVAERPLRVRQWVQLTATFDGRTGHARITATPQAASPGERLVSPPWSVEARTRPLVLPDDEVDLVFAAWRVGSDEQGPRHGAHFDGKLEAPRLLREPIEADALARLGDAVPPAALEARTIGWWDFAASPEGRRLVDRSPNRLDGRLENLPTRAVTGSRWDGREHDFRRAPDQYAAIHFHSDDVYDARWQPDFELVVPPDWSSAVYAVRLRSGDRVDHVPFFVAPPKGEPRAELALLVPTATYLAYANMPDPHAIVRRLYGSSDGVLLGELTASGGAYGPSCYEAHADGSGVHHGSHLRPVLNLKPRDDLWAWNADMRIVDWLEAEGIAYDVLTDELLHAEGAALLAPYRVIVTGTHPEYTSTAMLDALVAHQEAGGRLVYLGANGFYWRIAFADAWPGAIELRRAEDGTRAWASEPGEYHHAWTGELGGLWRRIGRPPNRLVGIGFTAQGFLSASSYRRLPAASDPRAAFVFDGVSGDEIGRHGFLGGAAGEEMDRFDLRQGSPPHALVLASASHFGPDVLKTKEEFLSTMPHDPADPDVRADLVFFETAAGGAVFSTGSIAWAGCLAAGGHVNDVARITANVVRRFLDPTPFSPFSPCSPLAKDATS